MIVTVETSLAWRFGWNDEVPLPSLQQSLRTDRFIIDGVDMDVKRY
jgi:hypothetical protein